MTVLTRRALLTPKTRETRSSHPGGRHGVGGPAWVAPCRYLLVHHSTSACGDNSCPLFPAGSAILENRLLAKNYSCTFHFKTLHTTSQGRETITSRCGTPGPKIRPPCGKESSILPGHAGHDQPIPVTRPPVHHLQPPIPGVQEHEEVMPDRLQPLHRLLRRQATQCTEVMSDPGTILT